jgi:fructose/tagatose bisphosphate aldolase
VLLKAVFGAARKLNVPVLVGASEGERDFMGTRHLAALVNSLREEFDFPIFLNADHAHSLPKALEATRIDILAPSVGNAHGMRRDMVAGKEKKRLNVDRIREIKEAAGIPLTFHGGSGTADEDLRMAIRAGINIVHINTELRVAWRRGLEEGLHQPEDAVVPYKILPSAVAAVQQVVSSRLKLFTNPILDRVISG